MIKCPNCEGTGLMGVFVCNPKKKFECSICLGTGEITSEKYEWIETGKLMSKLRKSKDLSLGELAEKLNEHPRYLSDMEHGKTKPDVFLYQNI